MTEPTNGLKIFVVDDHHDIADGMAELLALKGHDVKVAYSGEQAVRIFEENDFDISFMDVMMPGMNGVESFLAMRRKKPDAKVVMMTGYSVEQLLDQVMEKGAYGIMHKPISMDEIFETLDRVSSNDLVLIGGRDADFATSLQNTLEDKGYKTAVVGSGSQALSQALAGKADLLVLDQDLPVLGGLEVYMELQKRGRAIPTVMMTEGNGSARIGMETLDNFSKTEILTKPFHADQLLMALDAFSQTLKSRRDPAEPDPAVEEEQSAPAFALPGGAADEATPAEKGRLLVVDDDVDLLEGLADLMRMQGYEVRTAASEAAAKNVVKEFDAQVALLDIRLGKESGLDLLVSLREVLPKLLAVMVTGNADKESVITALQRGAHNYMLKPLNPEELFAIVRNCFDKHFLDGQMLEAFGELQTVKDEAEETSRSVTEFYSRIEGTLTALVEALHDTSNNLRAQPGSAESHLEGANKIAEIATQIDDVLSATGLLAQAKIGALTLDDTKVDIRDLVDASAEFANQALASGELEIHSRIPDGSIALWGDEHLLKLAVTNVIADAAGNSTEGTPIVVAARRSDDGAFLVEVTYTGAAPDSGEDSGAAEFGGGDGGSETGRLHMELAARLVELHEGVLERQSLPGGGKVAITLPTKRVVTTSSAA